MIEDRNKGIVDIGYNELNLPRVIDLGNNNIIIYSYTALGEKLKENLYFDGHLSSSTSYFNGFVYKDEQLEYIIGDEGRILNAEAHGFVYEYNIKDHPGYVRVCFTDENSDGNLEVTQENAYYSFGLKMEGLTYSNPPEGISENRLKYNQKEFQDALNWYDYGARFYDPQLGRFHSIDPLADKYNIRSPYSYAANNPLRFTDFLGMGPEDEVKKEEAKKVQDTKVKLTDITVTNKEGVESTVSVKFKDTDSDKKSSDNKVEQTLKDAFEGAVKEAAKETEITEITITATTNGEHGDNSRHSSAQALDIGGINGKSVTDIGDAGAVKELQKAFENQTGARENFGPSMMKKNGSEYISDKLTPTQKIAREAVKKQHTDHIHWSVD